MYGTTNRRRLASRRRLEKTRLTAFGRQFHHVDLVTIFILALLIALNSHYLIFLNLNLFIDDRLDHSVLASIMIGSMLKKSSYSVEEASMSNKSQKYISANISSASNSSKKLAILPINQQPPSMPSDELSVVCFPLRGTSYEKFLLNFWFYIDLSIYALIPSVVMIVCSFIILGKVSVVILFADD